VGVWQGRGEYTAKERTPRSFLQPSHWGLSQSSLDDLDVSDHIDSREGVRPTTINRYLNIGLLSLNRALRGIHDARVEWPGPQQQLEFAELIANKHPGLPFRPMAFLDGLNLAVYESGDFFEQNSHYNAWLAGTYISNIFVYAPDGTIIYARLNHPGCGHDSWVSKNLQRRILEIPGYLYPHVCIVADTAFPRTGAMRGRIVTPLKQCEMDGIITAGASRATILQLKKNHIRVVNVRQAAEWGMRQIEGCFGRLQLRLTLDSKMRVLLLDTMVLLHNLRVRRVGLSQIRTVYSPLWDQSPLVAPKRRSYQTPVLVM
jgi:hypothetical protein